VLQCIATIFRATDSADVVTALQVCVAVCCSVLQYFAVCCNVLQCVAVCCSVLPLYSVRQIQLMLSPLCRFVLRRVAVCCSVLQCVAVCCSVLQFVATIFLATDSANVVTTL